MGKKKLLSANAVSDFRPGIDSMVRRGRKCYIVDRDGLYKEHEVVSDCLTLEIQEKFDKLSNKQAAVMFEVVLKTPYLSREGRMERVLYMIERFPSLIKFDVEE